MAGNWVTFDWTTQDDEIPRSGGAYAIYANGALVYVGQSDNVRTRIADYSIRMGWGSSIFTPWGQCKQLTIKVRRSRRYGDWAMIEKRLIRRLQPQGNRIGVGRVKGGGHAA